jgi:hypothetical protein
MVTAKSELGGSVPNPDSQVSHVFMPLGSESVLFICMDQDPSINKQKEKNEP